MQRKSLPPTQKHQAKVEKAKILFLLALQIKNNILEILYGTPLFVKNYRQQTNFYANHFSLIDSVGIFAYFMAYCSYRGIVV